MHNYPIGIIRAKKTHQLSSWP